jgi:hypothetical protein
VDIPTRPFESDRTLMQRAAARFRRAHGYQDRIVSIDIYGG